MDKGITKPAFSQQYNLKWTNYTSNILQMFAEQFSKECFTDITLACEGQYIKAHKMVLSACSPYFEEMLNVYLVPHPMVVMNGIKFNLLKILIEFMYHGEVKVADEDLSNLLELAEQLQVKGLCNVRNKDNKDGKPDPDPDESTGSNTNGRKRRRTSTTAITEPVKNQNPTNQEQTSEDNVKPVDKPKTESDVKEEVTVVENKPIKTEKPSSNQTQKATETTKTSYTSYKIVPADMRQEQGIRMPPDYLHDSLKIRRPQNAFMIFANEFRKKLASENPGENNKEISVRLGNMWKTLPANVKSVYYSAAKKANDEHKKKHPGYYYSPKEARMRKELKSSVFRKNKSMEALQVVQLVMGEAHEDTPQLVYTECGDPDYDEVDFIHDIKEEEEEMINVCDSSTSFMKTSASQ